MTADPGPPATGRVIVTRSAADNRVLAAALGRAGLDTVEIPLVEVLPAADGGEALRRAVADLASYRWVVLTSANGVRALSAANQQQRWPSEVMVAPVGQRTATAAAALGLTVGPVPPIATAESLVDAFPTWAGTGSRAVLAPLAELAGGTVVDGLTAKGWVVTRIDAYRTAAPIADPDVVGRQADELPGADAVAFFSPSAVDRFVERFGVGSVPPVTVAIGPSTAVRAGDHGIDGVVTASVHTTDGVVNCLVAALRGRMEGTDH